MGAFEPVDSAVDFPKLEEAILERWRAKRVFQRSVDARAGCPEWVFYEGPPTANSRPGVHHVWARSFKDLFPRFHTMRGRRVERKGGWDCHGLPVEVEVEKELGFSGKEEIRRYGVEEFNRRCRESVHRYVSEFAALTERIGMWIDTEGAYWTLTNDYVESVWWLFRQMWDRGLIDEGHRVSPYCGRCGTALSTHEVAQGYRDVSEDSVYVRLPVEGADFDLLVWTTTPWTLVSNVAAAVSPVIDYARVRSEPRDLLLAAARVTAVLGEDAEIVARISGKDLVGLRYERPFPILPLASPPRVVGASFVTTEEGTGIVHLAPAFGEVDREVAEAEGLPVLNPVDPAARFDESVAPFAGHFVKDADPLIISELERLGSLLRVEPYTHSYPHCWRCGTPLVYYAKTSWFARTRSIRDELVAANETVSWHPAHIKGGRFGDWLSGNVDWALSRDRYWGTPIPVWRCDSPLRHDLCVGSVAELATLAGADLSALDLHRPYVDEVSFPCPEAGCGGTARRVEPVLDAWFDSGAMPSAQHHYPFEHSERFEGGFPADFICEGIDQTRGWFYSLLAVNTAVFRRAPYRNVLCLAHVVDAEGQKMSKSKGNAVDPWSVLTAQGADALRWYFFSAGSPWTSRRFSREGIDEAARRFLVTLWNTYAFLVTYADLSGWSPALPQQPSSAAGDGEGRHVLDRWLASRLHSTVSVVTAALESYDSLEGASALGSLVDDVSNWYVRRSRARFWKDSDPGAYASLHQCLLTVAKLLAPFCPFVADAIFLNLAGSDDSVHLEDWPAAVGDLVDPALEKEMALARRLVGLGRAARNEARVKVRQPLRRAFLLLGPGGSLGEEVLAEIAGELNVRRLELVEGLEGLISYTVVPNFRTLGPRLGSLVGKLKEALGNVDGSDVRRSLEEHGTYRLLVDGKEVELSATDVEIRPGENPGLALAQDGPYAVALDLAIDEDLRLEGLARELARTLNEARKTAGLAIADRVSVTLRAPGELALAARRHGGWIAGEVLATSWQVEDWGPDDRGAYDAGDAQVLLVDGARVGLILERQPA